VRSCWRVQLPPPLQVGDPLFRVSQGRFVPYTSDQ
jgi:hypothetical protein